MDLNFCVSKVTETSLIQLLERSAKFLADTRLCSYIRTICFFVFGCVY